MSLASHLAELQKRHSEIEQQIAEAQASPSVDDIAIVAMKRKKLALKDQIFRLRTERAEDMQTRH
jgi:hypothetical protein